MQKLVQARMQQVQDSVIHDFMRNKVQKILSPDREMQECIKIIKNDKEGTASDIKEIINQTLPYVGTKPVNRSRTRLRNILTMKSNTKPLNKEEKTTADCFATIQNDYRALTKSSRLVEKDAKKGIAHVMYNYRYCKAVLHELKSKEDELLSATNSFDYYIWQTAKRCVSTLK